MVLHEPWTVLFSNQFADSAAGLKLAQAEAGLDNHDTEFMNRVG